MSKDTPTKQGLANAGASDSPEPNQGSKALSLDKILLNLVHEVSSIRAGKTFTPTDYTEPAKQSLTEYIKEIIGPEPDVFDAGAHLLWQEQRKRMEM